MKVIADVCIVPVGVGISLSKYVAACERILRQPGLEVKLHAYGTNVEGQWDQVMAAVKACHEKLHDMGAPRITSSMRMGTRVDRAQTMQDKIDSVEDKLSQG